MRCTLPLLLAALTLALVAASSLVATEPARAVDDDTLAVGAERIRASWAWTPWKTSSGRNARPRRP